MNSNDIPTDAALKVFLEFREILGRIYQIKKRMDDRGFPKDDPLYSSTIVAWHAFIVLKQQWQRLAGGASSCISPYVPPPDEPPP